MITASTVYFRIAEARKPLKWELCYAETRMQCTKYRLVVPLQTVHALIMNNISMLLNFEA